MAIITHCAVVMCSTLTVWELAVVHLCLMLYSYRLRALIKHCSTIISSSLSLLFTLCTPHTHTATNFERPKTPLTVYGSGLLRSWLPIYIAIRGYICSLFCESSAGKSHLSGRRAPSNANEVILWPSL